MKQRLSELNIANLIKDELVFGQGKSIHKASGLKAVFRKGELVSGIVLSGHLKHQVDFVFVSELKFSDWHCTCGKSSETGFCSHSAAMLLGLQFEGDFTAGPDYRNVVAFGHEHQVLSKKGEAVYAFQGFLQAGQSDERRQVPFKIEIECLCSSYSLMVEDGIGWTVKMKAGEDRLYVVKKIGEFAKAVTLGERLVFGKNLTYDPALHLVSEDHRRLMSFIHMVTRLEQGRDSFSYGYSSRSIGSGNSKELSFKDNAVIKGFLEHMTHIPFEFRLTGRVKKGPYRLKGIREEDLILPLGIRMTGQTSKGQGMELSMPDKEALVAVSADGTYQLYKEVIYRFSDDHRTSLEAVAKLFDYHGDRLSVPEDSYRDFVSRIYPTLVKDFDLSLPQALADKVRKTSVKARVYFEQANRGDVLARLSFDYGEEEEGTYILRDLKTEEAVRQLFSGFSGDDEGYLLTGDYQVFRFAKYRLPLLREKAEVYYERGMKPLKGKFPKVQSGLYMGAGAWLEASFEGIHLDAADLEAVYNAMREKKDFVRLPGGTFIDLNDEDLETHFNLIEELELTAQEVSSGSAAVPLARALAMDSREDKSYDLDRGQRYREVLASFRTGSSDKTALPDHYRKILRPYQRQGFDWLVKLADLGLGGILADDMGLGKTLQTIAFLETRIQKGHGPCLVVAPTSLIYNWEEEVQKFAPDLDCLVLAGTKAERLAMMDKLEVYDLIITSYNLVVRDLEAYDKRIFACCVLDEAQKIKNPLSKAAKSVKALKARGYFALTGTPMENNLTELWSIFDFVMPGYLHSLNHFKEKHTGRGMTNEATKKLKQRISPFILRRLKKDVLTELPDKIETKSVAQMTHDQQKVYLAYMEHAREVIDKEISEVGLGKSHVKILSYLTRLRQICCHPGTFIDNYQGGSGKLEQLEEILQEALEAGHRILVFSQFTSMLGLIRVMLEDRGISYDYLDGSTKARDRQDKVKTFNEGDKQVFLISLKAGGTGLNLTGADMVIHFDPWWNPAVEDQATDRAYRIGQKNRVQVIKLIAHNSIEEKIYDLQQRKKAMIEAVIEPGETMLSKMSAEEVLALFD